LLASLKDELMDQSEGSRRNFLSVGAAGLVTGLAGAPLIASPAAAAAMPAQRDACGGFTLEQYLEYATLFNNNDPRFISFYHEDVEFELANAKIRGAKAILDFYAEVKAHIREKFEVTHFVSDATGVAAELPTEFRVLKDWENGYFGRPLKAGQVMRIVSLGLYWVEDGKFKRIKSARLRTINDWQMEA
jgi:SnoaL-like domain